MPERRFPAAGLRRRLRERECLHGIFNEIPCPEAVEIAGLAGWDFVIIDGEHGPLSASDFPAMVRAAQASGTAAVIRVPSAEPAVIQHALDSGAEGIQIPQVASVDAARSAIHAARFHPQGGRGLNPFVRASSFSSIPVKTFVEQGSDHVCLVLQLESAAGVNAAAEIGALPGLDVIFVGPYDLSQSLGIPGEVSHPSIYSAAERIIRAAENHGVATGVFTNSVEDARRWKQMGMRYVAYSVDTLLLMRAHRDAASALV